MTTASHGPKICAGLAQASQVRTAANHRLLSFSTWIWPATMQAQGVHANQACNLAVCRVSNVGDRAKDRAAIDHWYPDKRA